MLIKRASIGALLLMGVLVFTLACLEIPELSHLTDDISNDFTVSVHDTGAVVEAVDVKPAIPSKPAVMGLGNRQATSSTVLRERAVVVHSSRDLLHLYSIRRT